MKEEAHKPGCGRENDLISFLYGELNDAQSGAFQKHMSHCGSCSAELAAFQNVRDSVVAWRNDSLGGVLSTTAAAGIEQEGPSALRALREFFNLSPLWMKGAVAFASILFCLFGVLAVARWRDNGPAPSATYSEQEVQTLVEQRVQDELERLRNAPQQSPPAVVGAGNGSDRMPSEKLVKRRSELAATRPTRNARRPLSKVERQELAADLRLISGNNDSELELLDDRINQ